MTEREPLPTSIVDLVREHARAKGDAVALRFLEDGEDLVRTWTYRELLLHVARVSAALRDRCAPGDRAVLLYEPGLEYVAAFLGALDAGVVAVPAYPPRGKRLAARLLATMADAAPSLVLTSSTLLAEHASKIPAEIRELAPPMLTTDGLPVPASAEERRRVGPGELAMLQYTSGSTGNPKGVMVTHANLIANSEAIRRWLGPDPARRGCIWLPLFHDMGLLGGVLQPLYAGFPLTFLSPAHFIQSPVRWLRAISSDRTTLSGGPNFAYELCAQIPDEELAGLDLSCWKEAFSGAEPIRMETLRRFAERFAPYGFRAEALNPCYGLAEATLIVSGKPAGTAPVTELVDRPALERGEVRPAEGEDHARALTSSGAIVHGMVVRIVDPETRASCADGAIGEVWASGPSIAAGYWQRPAETEATFGGTLAGDERRYLRTGDLGYVAKGELFITGRLKDLFIIAGRNHHPEDIEATAEGAHGEIRKGGVAAFSVSPNGEEEVVLVAEVARRDDVDLAEVRRAVTRAVTAVHGVAPADVVLARAGVIPRTTSGKVRRQDCRRAYLDKTLRASGGAA